MQMYDTKTLAWRHMQERSVHAWMRAAAYAAGTDPGNECVTASQQVPDDVELEEAIESKKRDNLVLGEALVSIGLIGRQELTEVRSVQAENTDLVGSLLVASAIRSRLGEILLSAKRITSPQLEFALELQRHQGGLLGEILVSLGWLDRLTLDAALATQDSRQAA